MIPKELPKYVEDKDLTIANLSNITEKYENVPLFKVIQIWYTFTKKSQGIFDWI